MFAAHVENDHKWPTEMHSARMQNAKRKKTRMLTAYAKNDHKWLRRDEKAVTSQLRKEATDQKNGYGLRLYRFFLKNRARRLIS